MIFNTIIGKDQKKEIKSIDKINIDHSQNIIYFPQKYGSINIPYTLLNDIFEEILNLNKDSKSFFENSELLDNLEYRIKRESHYDQPQHVIRSVRMFLIDLGILELWEGAKRGKYVLKDAKALKEIAENKDMIIDFLNKR